MKHSQLNRNIIYNLLGQGTVMALGILAVKFIFNRLGEDALGIVYFVYALNTIAVGIFDLGIPASTVREISSVLKTEPEYIFKLIQTFSFLSWATFLFLGVSLFLLAPVLVKNWIQLKTLDEQSAIAALRLFGIASFLTFPRILYVNVLRGLQRMEFNNLLEAILGILQQCGMFLLLIFGSSFPSMIAWLALTYVLGILLYVAVLRRFFPSTALWPVCHVGVLKRNVRFSSRILFINAMFGFYSNIDKMIVSRLLPLGLFGYYAVARSMVSQVSGLFATAVSQAAYPVFSVMLKNGEKKGVLSRYQTLHHFLSSLIIPVLAGILFFFTPLFSYIFNRGVAELLFWPVLFLCVGHFMEATWSIPYAVSLASGKPGIAARQQAYNFVVILPVTFFMVYRFGLIGAGLSWAVFYLLHYAYGVPRICRECLEIPVASWFGTILRLVGITGFTYGLVLTTTNTLKLNSLGYLAVAYLLATVIYITIAYYASGEDFRASVDDYLSGFRLRGRNA